MRDCQFFFTPKIQYKLVAEWSNTNQNRLQFLTWCRGAELNHRRFALQANALPLSYRGLMAAPGDYRINVLKEYLVFWRRAGLPLKLPRLVGIALQLSSRHIVGTSASVAFLLFCLIPAFGSNSANIYYISNSSFFTSFRLRFKSVRASGKFTMY